MIVHSIFCKRKSVVCRRAQSINDNGRRPCGSVCRRDRPLRMSALVGTILMNVHQNVHLRRPQPAGSLNIQVFEGELSLTKSDRLLGEFDLTGISARALRLAPDLRSPWTWMQVACFEHCRERQKGTGCKREMLTITNEKRTAAPTTIVNDWWPKLKNMRNKTSWRRKIGLRVQP
jgi:hypothetical protein